MATQAASIVFEQGMRINPFIRPWLTMTKSTESYLKDRGKDDGMGVSGERVRWWLTLFCWHTMHPEMKALTNEERPGHQKSCSSRALVLKCPVCPVMGKSCMKHTMACLSCGGMYI